MDSSLIEVVDEIPRGSNTTYDLDTQREMLVGWEEGAVAVQASGAGRELCKRGRVDGGDLP